MIVKRLDKLQQLLTLVFASGLVELERPVSLLILALPGSGKSELLSGFSAWPGVIYTAYVSWSRLLTAYGDDIIGGRIHHLAFPDFSIQTSRGKEAAAAEFAALGTLMEEGLLRWETHRTIYRSALPRRVGVVACITREALAQVKEIAPTGFLSRFLCVSFSYSAESRNAILKSITNLEHRKNSVTPTFVTEPKIIKGNSAIFNDLWEGHITDALRERGDTYGFRAQKQLQTLLMANALVANRTSVTTEDLVTLLQLLPFFNEHYKTL